MSRPRCRDLDVWRHLIWCALGDVPGGGLLCITQPRHRSPTRPYRSSHRGQRVTSGPCHSAAHELAKMCPTGHESGTTPATASSPAGCAAAAVAS